jgi:hypothetical protein
MDVGGRATHGAVAERVGESEARGRGSIQQTLLLDSYPLFLAFSAIAPCIALSAYFWCTTSCIHAVVPEGEGILLLTTAFVVC